MSGEADQVLWRGVRPVEGIRGVWPARNAVRVNKRGSQVSVGTAIVYTVPAGKILFISSSVFTTRMSAVAGAGANMAVRDTDDVTDYYMVDHKYGSIYQQTTSQYYLPALEAAAGYDVTVFNSHAALQTAGIFCGWLEDA